MDFEKYGFSLFNKFRAKQLKRWFIFMIEQGKIKTREQLICEAKASMVYQDIEPLRTLGLSDSQFDELIVNTALEALDAARTLPLDRWLFATGIPGVGVTVAEQLAATHERLADLPGSPILTGSR